MLALFDYFVHVLCVILLITEIFRDVSVISNHSSIFSSILCHSMLSLRGARISTRTYAEQHALNVIYLLGCGVFDFDVNGDLDLGFGSCSTGVGSGCSVK